MNAIEAVIRRAFSLPDNHPILSPLDHFPLLVESSYPLPPSRMTGKREG